MIKIKKEDLLLQAKKAFQNAYAPYSNFPVGAALLAENGRVFWGCNMENAAYSPSLCAERAAFAAAIAAGERNFSAIAVASQKSGAFPCGVCRQVMMEFCDPETFQIICEKDGAIAVYRLKDLLPEAFSRANFCEKREK